MNKLDIPRSCEHCDRPTDRWIWRLVESYPQVVYQALCLDCAHQQDASFTPDQAICQALIVVGVRIGILNTKARGW